MTPEQEIRAAAISAAAAFCAPFSGVTDQETSDGTICKDIPNVEDVLFVADVFCGYIEGGWKEALGVHTTSGKQQEAPTVRNVELREDLPAGDILLPELESQSPPPRPPEKSSAPTDGERPQASEADVIPIQARGVVTKEQSKARRYVDKIKHKRALQIYQQSRVAKAEEHKRRLVDEAQEAGLEGFVLEVEGRTVELGSYLASL